MADNLRQQQSPRPQGGEIVKLLTEQRKSGSTAVLNQSALSENSFLGQCSERPPQESRGGAEKLESCKSSRFRDEILSEMKTRFESGKELEIFRGEPELASTLNDGSGDKTELRAKHQDQTETQIQSAARDNESAISDGDGGSNNNIQNNERSSISGDETLAGIRKEMATDSTTTRANFNEISKIIPQDGNRRQLAAAKLFGEKLNHDSNELENRCHNKPTVASNCSSGSEPVGAALSVADCYQDEQALVNTNSLTSLFAHVNKVKFDVENLLRSRRNSLSQNRKRADSFTRNMISRLQPNQNNFDLAIGGIQRERSRKLSCSLRSDGGSSVASSSLTPQSSFERGDEVELEEFDYNSAFLADEKLNQFNQMLFSESFQQETSDPTTTRLQQLLQKREELRLIDRQLFQLITQQLSILSQTSNEKSETLFSRSRSCSYSALEQQQQQQAIDLTKQQQVSATTHQASLNLKKSRLLGLRGQFSVHDELAASLPPSELTLTPEVLGKSTETKEILSFKRELLAATNSAQEQHPNRSSTLNRATSLDSSLLQTANKFAINLRHESPHQAKRLRTDNYPLVGCEEQQKSSSLMGKISDQKFTAEGLEKNFQQQQHQLQRYASPKNHLDLLTLAGSAYQQHQLANLNDQHSHFFYQPISLNQPNVVNPIVLTPTMGESYLHQQHYQLTNPFFASGTSFGGSLEDQQQASTSQQQLNQGFLANNFHNQQQDLNLGQLRRSSSEINSLGSISSQLHQIELLKAAGKGFNFDAQVSAELVVQKTSAFKCHVCHSGFEDRHRLQQHLSIHLNLNPSWFEEKTIKETMAQYELKRGDYLCKLCTLRFETTSEFDKHMQMHGEKPHYCDLCSQDSHKLISFRYYRQLLTHLRSHCFLYSCKFTKDCKQTANRKDYLKLHILKHHLNNKLPEQYTICCN